MKDQFSFYDIVAHVIPGAVGLAIIYWINAIVGAQLPLPTIGANDVGSSILFLIASYLLGTLAQAIGEGIEWPLLKLIWEWRSKGPDKHPMWYLLCNPNPGFQVTDKFQKILKLSIKEVFHLNLCNKSEPGTTIKAHGLCYSLIMQENAAQRSDKVKTIYRLFRGTFVILMGAHISLHALIMLIIPNIVSVNPFLLQLNAVILLLSISFIALFIAAGLTLWAFDFFSKLFPVTVYEDFYAWYGRKKFEQSHSSAPK